MKALLPLFLFLASSAGAQAPLFPASFVGHWEGTLLWHSQGKVQSVAMQLRIQPADSSGHYTWQLIYGAGGEDNRPYLLKPVDTARGHWMIDERNGIILDQYWLAGRLSASFTVQQTTIVNAYWLQGDTLHSEFLSLTARPVRKSGDQGPEIPAVESFGVKGYQKAVLLRRREGKRK
jgi:hypothetical protein